MYIFRIGTLDTIQDADFTRHQPAAVLSDPRKQAWPEANNDTSTQSGFEDFFSSNVSPSATSTQVDALQVESQKEDYLFSFDPLSSYQTSNEPVSGVPSMKPPQDKAPTSQEAFAVFQDLPNHAQPADQRQDMGSEMPPAHKQEARARSESLYENTDDIFPEIENTRNQGNIPRPLLPRPPIPTPRKKEQKAQNVKNDQELACRQFATQEETTSDAGRIHPAPSVRSRPLSAKFDKQPVSSLSFPHFEAHPTPFKTDFNLLSFSLPPLPNVPDGPQVDIFSVPDSKGKLLIDKLLVGHIFVHVKAFVAYFKREA